MIVVSDTTPLISLLKIERLDLLEKLFGRVFIPVAVYSELTNDGRFSLEAERIKQATFIEVKEVVSPEAVNVLRRVTGLDQGESEAIVLTDEINAELLLMDEVKGRTVSNDMGLNIMGTIGMLIAAYEEGIISSDEARACIDGLQRAGRHISNRHYQLLLDRLK